MDLTTSVKWCVVHFFKPDFGRCGVMDGHLEVLLFSSGCKPRHWIMANVVEDFST